MTSERVAKLKNRVMRPPDRSPRKSETLFAFGPGIAREELGRILTK
jgi:hypothetical protein